MPHALWIKFRSNNPRKEHYSALHNGAAFTTLTFTHKVYISLQF